MTDPQDLDWLAAHFKDSTDVFASSPLYRSLCEVVAADRATLELASLRQSGQQPSYLLFGAVHFLLLSGKPHHLREFYPSIVGGAASPGHAAGDAFIHFCAQYRDELADVIRTKLVQSNVVKRAFALRHALATIGARVDGPVHLVDVGTSAGLHLLVDKYRYLIAGTAYGDTNASATLVTEWRSSETHPLLEPIPPIASRTGVDLNPVDVALGAERLWLRALVWPEDQQKALLLTECLSVAASTQMSRIRGDAIDVLPDLGRGLPDGETRLVFHAATRMHVAEERRPLFDSAIDEIGRTGPLFHAWLEPPNAPHDGAVGGGRGGFQMHGPDGHQAVDLLDVDGHLEWMAPLRKD